MRHIIREKEQIVALDTSIVRELCYSRPSWVSTFMKMKSDGYHFCLSDLAFGEFIHGFEVGKFGPYEYAKSMKQLSTFISTSLPILPGPNQLAIISKLSTKPRPTKSKLDLIFSKSVATWRWLLEYVQTPEDLVRTIPEVRTGRLSYRIPFKSGVAEQALQALTGGWKNFLSSFDAFPKDSISKFAQLSLEEMQSSLDAFYPRSKPRASVRLDLWLKLLIHDLASYNKSKEPYNPNARKRRNDSLDATLLFTLMLPAFVCALDDKFIRRLANKQSFQSEWVVQPSTLAAQWTMRTRPTTSWDQG